MCDSVIANSVDIGVTDEFGHDLLVTSAEAKKVCDTIQLRVTIQPPARIGGAREAKGALFHSFSYRADVMFGLLTLSNRGQR
jgi:hypothetical protein